MAKIDLYPNLKSPPADAKVATGTPITGDKFALDVFVANSITGTFQISGLTIGGRITTQDITDTYSALPSTPLADRNALAIRNTSLVDSVYVGYATTVTADNVIGVTSGWVIGPNEDFNIDITDSVLLYAITETGKTCRIKINEVA